MAKAFTNALPGLLAGSVGTMYLVEQTILNPNNANSNSNNSPSLFGALLQNLFSARQNSNSNNGGLLSQQPLVINMPGGSPNSNQKQLLTYLLGPVLIFWGGYFLSHALPSSISDLLPVSKALFSSAVGAIGRGLINVRDDLVKVRDSLLKQFDILNKKHDDLAEDVDSIKKGEELELKQGGVVKFVFLLVCLARRRFQVDQEGRRNPPSGSERRAQRREAV